MKHVAYGHEPSSYVLVYLGEEMETRRGKRKVKRKK